MTEINLIEQLGGYECAKSKLRDNGSLHAERLKKALLEYRRQHNIFEAGDICKLKIKHDFGLYKFRRIDGDRIYLEDRLGFAEFGINKGVVEHATDAEIKAGKRLDAL
ncbi:hypothetical protein [Acinetobacter sp. ANC 5045]|uniref:hypothetical protein n=1 Tax=Acinetobacter sp. ANC 5045 TaxID=2529851 RepID=UPI00103B1026|nr:hypothetical protein [Acinetobacter sp. ANC 5045]TCB16112.1 hypothetical protein E0H79_10290 [Acinetobacter sp. ANC 5045]